VFLDAFKAGLREFGWIDGKNIVIDVHWARRIVSATRRVFG
jgi:hypothetical protein